MALIRDRALLNEDGSVPFLLLNKCIQEHTQEVEGRLNKLNMYYGGKHEILKRKFDNPDIPNNKLVCNHAEYISNMAVGYVFGIPVSYAGDNADKINEIFTEIEEDSHNNELALDISIFGRGHELIYMSDDDVPLVQLASLSPLNTFLVVDSTVMQKPLFAVHYYANYDLSNTIKDYTIEVYLEDRKETYIVKDLKNESQDEDPEVDEHFFKGIPVIEYKNNKNSIGDFEGVISLIDAYNKLQSDRVNDKEQLVDAFLVIVGQSLGDNGEEVNETVKTLREQKIIELDQDGDAKWLVKELNEEQVEVLKNSLKEDIHEFSRVPCLTDKEFVGNSSGVAMKYKLLGFEQLGATKERYFKKGLRQRLKLIANVENIRAKNINTAIDINMKRSLPVDDELLARIAQETEGFLSWETRVKNYDPEIDVKEEKKRLDEEKKKNLKMQQAAFDSQFPSNNEDEEEEEKPLKKKDGAINDQEE